MHIIECPFCGASTEMSISQAERFTCPKCGKTINLVEIKTARYGKPNSGKPERQGTTNSPLTPVPLTDPAPSEPDPVLPTGTKLGQYEIRELIGRGGMGTVYKAYQPLLERFVAIKVLPANLVNDKEFVRRFNREAKALAGLSHPSIVAIYDIGRETKYFYFVMEFVEGVTVRDLLEGGKLVPEEAFKIVPQLCEALEYAHDGGVVHRDIKPENILIDKKGRVKVTDFGLARIIKGDIPFEPITRTREIMGTYDYMAPEQREDPKIVDHRADIYSLGVVFYEMLTGELPIGKFASPSQKVQIDVRLDAVVLKALEKEPARRYQRASELGEAVTEIITSAPDGVPQEFAPEYLAIRSKKTAKFIKHLGIYLAVNLIIFVLCLTDTLVWGMLAFTAGAWGIGVAMQLVNLLTYIYYPPMSQVPTITGEARWSNRAITGFILSFIPLIVTQIVSIILGITALRKINRSQGLLRGTGLAIAGIVISIVVFFILASMIIPEVSIFSPYQVRVIPGAESGQIQSEALYRLCLANEIYRRADINADYSFNYAGSVKELAETESLAAILGKEADLIAQSDQGILGNQAKPYHGYFCRAIPERADLKPKEPIYQEETFTFAVYPAQIREHALHPQLTYIVDQRGIIYAKELRLRKYPDDWNSYRMIESAPGKWEKKEIDPETHGWAIVQRLDLSDTYLKDAWAKVKTLLPQTAPPYVHTPEDIIIINRLREHTFSADPVEFKEITCDALFERLKKEFGVEIQLIQDMRYSFPQILREKLPYLKLVNISGDSALKTILNLSRFNLTYEVRDGLVYIIWRPRLMAPLDERTPLPPETQKTVRILLDELKKFIAEGEYTRADDILAQLYNLIPESKVVQDYYWYLTQLRKRM